MGAPIYLARLMAYTGLSRRLKLGPEDRIAVRFADELRVAALEGRLRAVFSHVPNELIGYTRKSPVNALARAAGVIPGSADYWFAWGGGSALLEAKSADGRLSDNQKDMRSWCEAVGVPYHVFRSVDEGLDILRGLGVLI
jgi:hypothetical protein